jgi:hypothetical protein
MSQVPGQVKAIWFERLAAARYGLLAGVNSAVMPFAKHPVLLQIATSISSRA